MSKWLSAAVVIVAPAPALVPASVQHQQHWRERGQQGSGPDSNTVAPTATPPPPLMHPDGLLIKSRLTP